MRSRACHYREVNLAHVFIGNRILRTSKKQWPRVVAGGRPVLNKGGYIYSIFLVLFVGERVRWVRRMRSS